jgi:hypothetical protein
VLAACFSDGAEAARRAAAIEPAGTWTCVLYGHPAFGDERVLLHFAASGAVRLARLDDDKATSWNGLTGWVAEDDELQFSDPWTGRHFTADLRRTTLGGGWRTLTAIGGWWCSPIDNAEMPPNVETDTPKMPPLRPSITSTPTYPLQAIRDAKQGRAVACFFVDSEGFIQQPEFIELSAEVFRAPILTALKRSRYQGWQDDGRLRPGCRSYIFKLDSLLKPEVEPDS